MYGCAYSAPRRRFYLGLAFDHVDRYAVKPIRLARHVVAFYSYVHEDDAVPRDLVLKPSGSIAWIAERVRYDPATRQYPRDFLVYRRDSRGLALLDSGADVEPTSLELRGDLVTWLHGAELRSSLF